MRLGTRGSAPGTRRFRGRMERLEVERLGRAAGLPEILAERVARVVVESGLPDDRREEVLGELVSHFADGLAAGKTPEQLLAAFGDGSAAAALIKEAKQVVTPESAGGAERRAGWFERLGRDTRYAIRRLSARPAFTAIAVLSLALGIGANSAVFTLVNDVILRKSTLAHPEELVDLYRSSSSFSYNVFSEPDVADLRRNTTAFAGIASAKMSMVPFEVGGRIEKLTTEMVSSDYFTVLGLKPLRGRLFDQTDAPAPGQGAVVVLSERFWRRLAGADPAIIGKSLRLNGASYVVTGILPADYAGRLRAVPTDLYVPVMMIDQIEPAAESQLTDRGTSGTFVTARLKPGVSMEQAHVELDRVAAGLKAQRLTGWQEDATMTVLPKADAIIYPPIDQILVPVAAMLMVVVGLVLVIACANLAGFLLARAVDRRKEIAVRLALGATRGQLVSQLLVETILLALVGGIAGAVLGRAALRVVLATDIPLPVTVDLALTVDWRVLGFSILVSVVAGVFFGLVPALQATRLDLASVIRAENTGGGRAKLALRNVLVGGQVAVSMVLLVIAGLFARSLDVARKIDAGFGARPAAMVWMGLPVNAGAGAALAGRDRVVRNVAAMPGVVAVGLTSNIHLNTLGVQGTEVTVPGIEPPPGRTTHDVDRAAIDTGFIAASGLRLTAGRNFTLADSDTGWRTAIVNEAFGAKFFPGRDPLGQRFRSGTREIEIVGVVNTAKIRSLGEVPRPFIYVPIAPPEGPLFLLARTSGNAEQLAAAIVRTMAQVAPETFVMQSGTLAAHISAMSYPLRMGAAALLAFALVALLMACIGLYGAVSYAVSQRSREVGIRLSLGAGSGAVIRLLLTGGLRLVAGGAVVGMVLALIAGKLLEGLLFGIKAFDPVTLVTVPVLLLCVAALAAYLPARRAGRIDPITALKAE